MNERLIIWVRSDGRVSARTEGIIGARCLAAVPLLEDLLGAAATDSRYTSEFFEQTTAGTAATAHTDTQQENST